MGSEAHLLEERGFAASLAERVAVLRGAVAALREAPESSPLRARVQRRLHALGAGARTVGFFEMAVRICDAQSVLEATERVCAADLAELEALFDELPTLTNKEALPPAGLPRLADSESINVCVVGDRALAALLKNEPGAKVTFASARFDDCSQVWAALHPAVPDVFVIDVDVPGARAFVSALIDDVRTELVPIVALGRFATRDDVAHYVALGVTRTFTKPAQALALRSACAGAVEQRRGRTIRMEMPGIVAPPRPAAEANANADANANATAMPTPTPAPAATATEATAPEPEIELAAVKPTPPPAAPPPPLPAPLLFVGRRIVTGDDDPVVTWFLADHFRKMGCIVDEAVSGAATLARALDVERCVADLVFADLGMRDVDGRALCRALRADPATRDVPIVLQSWNEPLLDAARRSGAPAALIGKGATPETLAAKAAELLEPHARLRARLRAGGALSGTLANVTVLRLLAMATDTPRTLKITLKDGGFTHELVVMGGALRGVVRMGPDGRVEMGSRAIATALGLTQGTFEVADTARVEASPCGVGFVVDAVNGARALADAARGAHLRNVAPLRFDPDVVHVLAALPEEGREIAERLVSGVAPRALLSRGEKNAPLLESVIVELCRRGFVCAVREESPDLEPPAPPDLTDPAPPVAPPPQETTMPLLLARQRIVAPIPAPVITEMAHPPAPAPIAIFAPPPPVPVPVRAPAPVPIPAPIPYPAPAPMSSFAPPAAPAPEPPSFSVPIFFDDPQHSRPMAAAPPPPAPLLPPPPPPPILSLSPPPGLSLPVMPARGFELPLPAVFRRDAEAHPPTTVTTPPPAGPSQKWRRAAAIAACAVVVGVAARWTASGAGPRKAAAGAADAPRAPIALPPQGLLEVSAADGVPVLVDGAERGRGPKLSVTLPEGSHEVKTGGEGGRTRLVEILRGKVTHVDLAWKPAPVPPTK